MTPYALAIHGGAGLIRPGSLSAEREVACRAGLHDALEVGRQILAAGGSALDAVEATVVQLEEHPLFNAGKGAVFAANGTIELDAAIMDGATREAGAVAMLHTTRNPIRAARTVMTQTPHVLMIGAAADALAATAGLEQVGNDWFRTEERWAQLQRAQAEHTIGLDHGGGIDSYGTVGAVACDRRGHVAAASSTGGMVNKHAGRVGDTPIIGAGTWASDRTCAVSGTGHGEPFIRLNVCSRIAAWMEMGGLSLQAAADRVISTELVALQGTGGAIAVDARGNIAMPFNSAGMFRGRAVEGAAAEVAIW